MKTPLLVPFFALTLALSTAACDRKEGGEVASLPDPDAEAPQEPPDMARSSGGEISRTSGMNGPSGTLEARRRSTLSPRVSGVVTKVHVRDGDRVQEGDALVSLDTEDFALRTRQAQAGSDAARAGFEAAEAEWKRSKALLADKALPQAQFDAVAARYAGAKAQLAQAEVALAMARKSERDAILRAPFPGVIVRRFISEGEYASLMPATNLVTLEETGVFDLRVYVPADRASAVKTGDKVTVRLPGLAKDAAGKVLQLLPAVDSNGTAAVLIEVPDPENTLRPGMTAEAVAIRQTPEDRK